MRITKDDDSVVNGIESVWIDIVTDSLDDYGVYHCVAENVVSFSKLNYTFEVKRSGWYWLHKINMIVVPHPWAILVNDLQGTYQLAVVAYGQG